MSDHRNSGTAPESIGELSENIVEGLAEAQQKKDITDLLEEPIINATRMASVLATLLENSISKDLAPIVGAKGKDTYHILLSERDDIFFAAYRVRDFLRDIQAAFEEAIR